MIVDIFSQVVQVISKQLAFEVKFIHGNTLSVVNYITKLQQTQQVYPAIIMFQERVVERRMKYFIEVEVPKIAIVTTTKIDLTDQQRLQTTFKHIIYPIFNLFEKQMQDIHCGYQLIINRTDIPFYSDSTNSNTFNQLVDGCVIKDLQLRIEINKCKKIK